MTTKAVSFPRKRESITPLVSTLGFSLDARLRGHDGHGFACAGMTTKAVSFPRKRESMTPLVSTAGFSLDARLRGHDGSIRLNGRDGHGFA